ncbi:hypothetical protein PLICRDRAFT_108974 [Plicaturopsis crispa FD-325 SS-3]|nr:hypothetical protein PLICRDRAFT_108974 [Plicaturopsis crispa FD-325 SS-3]
MPPERCKLRLCTCVSHCTRYNALTNQYEGGRLQTRTTRYNHKQDDRYLAAMQNGNGTRGGPSHLAITPVRSEGHPNESSMSWIDLFEKEVSLYSTLPYGATLLVFSTSSQAPRGINLAHQQGHDTVQPVSINYALRPRFATNEMFLATETRLRELSRTIYSMDTSDRATALIDRIHQQLDQMTLEKRLEWERRNVPYDDRSSVVVHTEIHFAPLGPLNPIRKASSILSLILENMFFVPRRGLRAQLSGLRDVLRSMGDISATSLSLIPKDPSTARSHFRLDPTTTTYISCTKCFCLYRYSPGDHPHGGVHGPNFPLTCTHKKTRQSEACGASLWKQRSLGGERTMTVPCRTYLHNDLKSWLGRLLCRPGMEDILEKTGEGLRPDGPDPPVVDIWQSKVFASLVDPSGQSFLPSRSNGELRLVFALAADGFNPNQNKMAKKQSSTFAMWLVLLNFPPHLRYRPENIFPVGFIAGKPSIEEVNHALQLVVNDLKEFWKPGVRFSRTYKYRLGRLALSILIPLICDMLGARQMGGFSSATSHYFCTLCHLDIDDIDILDRGEWPARNEEMHRRRAEAWRDAESEADRKHLAEAHGIRWSALLDLEYWRPVIFIILESMHALDLNLFPNHCRNLFQIDTKSNGGDGFVETPPMRDKCVTTLEGLKSVARYQKIIDRGPENLSEQLFKAPRKVLYTLCVRQNILGVGNTIVVGTKEILVGNICRWVSASSSSPVENESNLVDNTDGMDIDAVPFVDPPPQAPTNHSLPETLADGQPVAPTVLKAAARFIRYLGEDQEDAAHEERVMKQVTVAALKYICALVGIHVELPRTRPKRPLWDQVKSWVSDSGEKENARRLLCYVSTPNPPRHILGKDVMELVWNDMKRTRLPSWVASAPQDWGTATRGKLSADQWRVICTIHLPITLIRLWGNDTGRRHELLRNFMDLVSAVRIANMRVTSRTQIDAYNHYIFRYVAGITRLYPDQQLKTTHHEALHLGDTTELFGPVHSHSAPFYERYIHVLQRLNTNKIPGEMEGTFLHSASRDANIRAMLADDADVRNTMRETVKALDAVANEDARGIRLAHMLDPDQPEFDLDAAFCPYYLNDDEHQQLSHLLHTINPSDTVYAPRQVECVDRISIHGVRYATSASQASSDSSVMFSPLHLEVADATPTRSQTPGTIKAIFRCLTEGPGSLQTSTPSYQYYLAVLEYKRISGDPYSQFGFAAGFMCEVQPEETHLIQLSQVVAHFAKTPITLGSGEAIHVLPLDRVRPVVHSQTGLDFIDRDPQLMLNFGVGQEQDGIGVDPEADLIRSLEPLQL